MTSSQAYMAAAEADTEIQTSAPAGAAVKKAAGAAAVLHGLAGMGSWVASAMAGLMAKPGKLPRQTCIDPSTGLLNRESFMVRGDRMLNACHRDKRAVTVAVFACEDLLAIRRMYGRNSSHMAVKRLVNKINGIAGLRGLAARTGMTEFTVMLPGVAREKALRVIARQLGNPVRIEFDAGEEEVVMLPAVVVETPGVGETSIENLLAEMSADARTQMQAFRDTATAQQVVSQSAAAKRAMPVMEEYLPDSMDRPHLPPTMPVALGAH